MRVERAVVAARLRAIALMAPAMLLWVLMESLFRFDRHSTFQVVWTRYGVYLALLLLFVAPRRGCARWWRRGGPACTRCGRRRC